jgi:hypothetical protein
MLKPPLALPSIFGALQSRESNHAMAWQPIHVHSRWFHAMHEHPLEYLSLSNDYLFFRLDDTDLFMLHHMELDYDYA